MSGSKPFILGRDANGLYAYSSTCTHQGCTVPAPAAAGSNSMCPCHLSLYDDNGHLLQPAPGSVNQQDLVHFAIVFTGTGDSATFVVDGNMIVPADMRYPAP
jgi:Rieske Fe-S protein